MTILFEGYPKGTFFTFDGGYGRQGYAKIVVGECWKCETKDVPILYSNGSEGEYAGCALCLSCINEAFKTMENP